MQSKPRNELAAALHLVRGNAVADREELGATENRVDVEAPQLAGDFACATEHEISLSVDARVDGAWLRRSQLLERKKFT